ncbi:hypothetical protein B0H11DRAFT_2405433 [Mycena galericulata]|nr:hypothetical protein B0H11DRAFT_2405433 [Mycena galericulata]
MSPLAILCDVPISTGFDGRAPKSCVSLDWVFGSGLRTRGSQLAGLLTLPCDMGVISMNLDVPVAASLDCDLVLGLDWLHYVLKNSARTFVVHLTCGSLDLRTICAAAVQSSSSPSPAFTASASVFRENFGAKPSTSSVSMGGPTPSPMPSPRGINVVPAGPLAAPRMLHCHTRYYPNYYVHDKATTRTYYIQEDIPEFIHSSEHFYTSADLCELFANMMATAWTSGTNCARIYNASISKDSFQPFMPTNWLSLQMDVDDVYNSFFLYALLLDHHEHQQVFELEHNASSQAERLRPALEARNTATGFTPPSSMPQSTDISESPSRLPVSQLETEATGADLLPAAFVEELNTAARLDSDDSDNEEIEYPGCDGKPEKGNRVLRARFGRKRTHNEQLNCFSCGIIAGRATFFGSEAPNGVREFWMKLFPTKRSLPGVLWHDNNCSVVKMLRNDTDPYLRDYFENVALPVDVFHFKSKHKETDLFCGANCNPYLWPELRTEDGKWRFNSSAAEQTNAWFGGFHSIVREMLVDRYNFFLDEMIKRRNRTLIKDLYRRGKAPGNIPREYLLAEDDEDEMDLSEGDQD